MAASRASAALLSAEERLEAFTAATRPSIWALNAALASRALSHAESTVVLVVVGMVVDVDVVVPMVVFVVEVEVDVEVTTDVDVVVVLESVVVPPAEKKMVWAEENRPLFVSASTVHGGVGVGTQLTWTGWFWALIPVKELATVTVVVKVPAATLVNCPMGFEQILNCETTLHWTILPLRFEPNPTPATFSAVGLGRFWPSFVKMSSVTLGLPLFWGDANAPLMVATVKAMTSTKAAR